MIDKTIERISYLVKKCGMYMLSADRTDLNMLSKSGHANFVTKYDKAIEETLKIGLKELIPSSVFIGEEEEINNYENKGMYTFVVDPLDGTTNFIKDYRHSCISVALLKENDPYIGVIYDPYLDELFTAKKDEGAFLNGDPIHVSECFLKDGLVIFGTSPYYKELQEKTFSLAFKYFQSAMDIRRSGSAALDLCSIACGRAELFFELRLSPWDFAAGSVILTEAGGIIEDIDGHEIDYTHASSIVAASNRSNILRS